MTKAIVYYENDTVTGIEYVEPNMLEAFLIGLTGQDAVNFDRACKTSGRDVVLSFTKTAPRITEDAALTAVATKSGRTFLLVDPGKLPPGEFDGWRVAAGQITAVKSNATKVQVSAAGPTTPTNH